MCTLADVARRWLRAALHPRLSLLLSLAPLACGGSSSSDPDAGGRDASIDAATDPFQLSCEPASGSRVRQVVREHGDGTSQFIRLHDSEFAEDCSFAPASDGALRCLPLVDGAPFADGAIRYTDDACTAAIGQLNAAAGVPGPRYMREQLGAQACAAPTTAHFFHELGEPVAIAPGATIYFKASDACIAEAALDTDFFAITPLPPDRFVAGTASFSDSGRIAVGQVDGEDGSRFCDAQGALRDDDVLSGHPCFLRVAEDGSLRCLPNDVGPTQVFSDEVCATPIEVALLDQCRQEAAYVVDNAGAVCALRTRVRTVDPALPAQPYQGSAKVCAQVPAELVAHGVGASVSPFSFAELTRERTPVGGRLERIDLASDDGLRLAQQDWYDTELDEECTFIAAADGAQRCLPIDSPLELTATVTSGFSDSSCTVAVTLASRDPSCAKGDPRFALEVIGGGRTRVYDVGEAAPGPLFQLGKTCVEDASGRAFYRLGAERVAQDFVGGTEMVE